ncbi:MAG TPA: pyrrolo-quinoline quinone [Candidatus Binatia bacterium]|nr:pyrrolo-quinoline quinone [Candidatus Binatia bacterium]
MSFGTIYCGGASSSAGASTAPTPSTPTGPGLQIPYPTDVLTYHYNVFRQGLTQQETTLTPSNVNSSSFGKIEFFTTDGKVDAQPLFVNKQFIGGSLNDTVYVVTENDSIYAFSANSGRQFWRVSALGQGETPSDNHGCSQISPQIGITDTPVIDKGAGPNGAIYFVAMTKDTSGHYHQRLHALDLMSGGELFGGPVEIHATYPGTGDGSQGGMVIFDPGQFAERAGILQYGTTLYLAFTSHCDFRPYTGWIMAYNGRTLAQTSVIDVTPNGNEGAIWMAGSGLAADSAGNIYFLDGNGTFDTTLNSQGFPINGDYGNAFVKLSNSSGQLQVADYFNMYNTVQESNADEDLGSGGVVVLPDLFDNGGQVHHLAVGAGKDTNIYVVDRDNMGKFNPNNNNQVYQEIQGALPGGIWAKPAYFNNTVYYGDVSDNLKAYTISNARLSTTPTSQSSDTFPYPGTIPSVSADLNSNGIVWAVANSNPAVLYAYDATNLAHELYNSNQAGSRDQFGPGNKFITPMIANGKVFVGTQTGVAVFGLLP